jgi:hypothetical protein
MVWSVFLLLRMIVVQAETLYLFHHKREFYLKEDSIHPFVRLERSFRRRLSGKGYTKE